MIVGKYKGFSIDLQPKQLRGCQGWIFQLDVRRYDTSGLTVWPIYLKRIFATSGDAIEAGLICARRSIDKGLTG
jgi:hypothetical protein